jgi:hypothetical protein
MTEGYSFLNYQYDLKRNYLGIFNLCNNLIARYHLSGCVDKEERHWQCSFASLKIVNLSGNLCVFGIIGIFKVLEHGRAH